MTIIFYPYEEDLDSRTLEARLELLMLGAERYKTIVLDMTTKPPEGSDATRRMVPRDLTYAYNWQELARLLRELRELPEQNQVSRLAKATYLARLAEIYEVLRGAKMPKLEAVRLALVNEASQLRTGIGTA
ncbi:MAG: hypothetical protein K0S27_417 [Gammaproteobacteria bacterium]|jgi:hypothetical protein|nr:hypothetical protein [Gammaproteobacteria bacterium]